MKRISGFIAVLLCLLVWAGQNGRVRPAAASLPVPPLKGYVNDEAGMLTARQSSTIESMLRAYQEKTTNQVVLLTIPSLEGDSLEDFSMRVAEQWKIGQKGKDNGVIFLVSLRDRKSRIEVGYGLEGVLTDALSSRILRQVVSPAFRQGNYFGGIAAGLEAILQATEGEFEAPAGLPGLADHPKRLTASGLLFFIIFLLLVSARIGRLFLLGGLPGGGRTSYGRSFGGRSLGGFGGFSGGGGGFGGGGASGSW